MASGEGGRSQESLHPDFARMRSLVMSFRGILQAGKVATLARWMKKANGSGIYGMKRFVRKLKHDLAAVKNALRESWSNGPVEGHINRLKTLKRQMYGRAGFELLRARLLPMSRGSPCTVIEEEPKLRDKRQPAAPKIIDLHPGLLGVGGTHV